MAYALRSQPTNRASSGEEICAAGSRGRQRYFVNEYELRLIQKHTGLKLERSCACKINSARVAGLFWSSPRAKKGAAIYAEGGGMESRW